VSRPRVGVITGLKREAACLRRERDRGYDIRSGAGPIAAARAAREALAAGCRGLVSFGFAGALSPELTAGALIVPETVIGLGGERWRTDEAWRRRVLSTSPDALTAPLLGIDAVVGSPAAKSALAAGTGAIAVDTESHAVARIAWEAGVPFLAVRAVSDAAGDALPGWLLASLDERGEVRPLAFAAALLRDPRRLAAVLTLFRGSRRALARLRALAASGALGRP
jgi:adenosylhomocysteine nucleosidase